MSRVTFFIAAAMLAGGLVLVERGAERPHQETAATPSTAASSSASPAQPPAIPPGYRIQIPRVGVDLPIVEGDLDRDVTRLDTPESDALHLPGTGIPGGGRNTYLYAHARRGMFLSLWTGAIGDEVWVRTPDGGSLRYVITQIERRVPASDVSWASPDGPERMTLQTSTGPNPDDPRFVVIAHPE